MKKKEAFSLFFSWLHDHSWMFWSDYCWTFFCLNLIQNDTQCENGRQKDPERALIFLSFPAKKNILTSTDRFSKGCVKLSDRLLKRKKVLLNVTSLHEDITWQLKRLTSLHPNGKSVSPVVHFSNVWMSLIENKEINKRIFWGKFSPYRDRENSLQKMYFFIEAAGH